MKYTKDQPIGEIVASDYRTAQIFQKFGLDFCCGGNKTIQEAATEKEVNPIDVEKALGKLGSERIAKDYSDWTLDFLIDYIVKVHHRFTRDKLREMNTYVQKVAKVHGSQHQELYIIYEELSALYTDLINHLTHEEEELFPYIKKLAETDAGYTEIDSEHFGTGAQPISMREGEHEEAGEAMKRIRRLTNDFTPPEDACRTYRVLYKNLKAFEKDLHKHVHLENNILFPKALELEKKIQQRILG